MVSYGEGQHEIFIHVARHTRCALSRRDQTGTVIHADMQRSKVADTVVQKAYRVAYWVVHSSWRIQVYLT